MSRTVGLTFKGREASAADGQPGGKPARQSKEKAKDAPKGGAKAAKEKA